MAAQKYTFIVSNSFPNGKVNPDRLTKEITDSNITITLDRIDVNSDICDVWFKSILTSPEESTLNSLVAIHSGELLTVFEQVEVVNRVKLDATNVRGKIEVHESSRVPGTRTYYTGTGDDPDNIMDVGGGTQFVLHHRTDDPTSQYLYLDFNIVENETWIHEGYIIWNQAQFDMVSFEIVPRVVSVVPATGTFFNLYGGYLVVPAAGDGTIQITSDITSPNGGLVHIPLDYDGLRTAPCFWNADWNSTTKAYENISAAPFGNGNFNMFAAEVTLSRFVNKISVLGSGFEMMQSADADQVGQGMRLRAKLDTNMPDHYWSVGCNLTMHRARSS